MRGFLVSGPPTGGGGSWGPNSAVKMTETAKSVLRVLLSTFMFVSYTIGEYVLLNTPDDIYIYMVLNTTSCRRQYRNCHNRSAD